MTITSSEALGIQIPGKDMSSTQVTEVAHTHSPDEHAPTPSSQPETPKGVSPPSDNPDIYTAPISPLTPTEEDRSRDSMSSIALTESSLDFDHLSAHHNDDILATPRVSGIRHMRKPSSLEIISTSDWGPPSRQSTLFDVTKDSPLATPISAWPDNSMDEENRRTWPSARPDSIRSNSTGHSTGDRLHGSQKSSRASTSRSGSTCSADDNMEVDWSQLDRNEEQEKADKDIPEDGEDESTAFLLARLEQENAKFSQDPKSAIPEHVTRARKGSRPPSMGHLKKLVENRNTTSHRYSLAVEMAVPDEPPPMTELEFWAALVQDYPSTASRLPTLTTTKIRGGIPPPLRGVVWTSMSGARDAALDEAYEKLQGEKSPYEGIINKDVGRSFPGVELFREADGEGQKMLGRVLKCFSLHDKDIGYCQGLGFLVGPLLMNMGEKEAFCVLVKLMDHYSLRPSFLPSLSGLHMRIYQFSSLLKEHNQALSDHLTDLGIEPAYLSQWFLSCFAVTCPLPLLFRIYDVIFAEGANETVMRVAMALVRRNEEKMLECSEFEEVMQLLLGRAIWDPYGCNPDELVDDFTSLGNIITHTKLAELEKEFDNKSTEVVGQSAGFLPDVQAAASRFIGRLWAPAHSSTPSKAATLAPASAEKESSSSGFLHSRSPSFFLRRTPSKQSISISNDSQGSESTQSAGSVSTGSTAPTEADDMAVRGSVADTMSLKSKAESSLNTGGATTPSLGKEQQDLHGQIEDLLTALSEMQRDHAQMAALLQKEREDRSDDHRAIKQLVAKLKGDEEVKEVDKITVVKDKRKTLPPLQTPKTPHQRTKSLQPHVGKHSKAKEVEESIAAVEARLVTNSRMSATFETKAQLRSNLARTREQLAAAEQYSRDLATKLEGAEQAQTEAEELRSEVEELRTRVSDEFKTRQKLEHALRETKAQARAMDRKSRGNMLRAESSSEVPTLSTPDRDSTISERHSTNSSSGLRELKLGRRDSTSSIQSIRSQRRQSSSPTLGGARDSFHINKRVSIPPIRTDATQKDTSASASDDDVPETPASEAPPETPVSAMALPSGGAFAPRTTSLATKEVFATPEHESVPQEALLLELVNAKTAEAQARQEIDEMKRALNHQKRRHDEAIQQAQADANAAREEAKKSAAIADAARAEAAATLLMTPSLSMPGTPMIYDSDAKDVNSNLATPVTPNPEVKDKGADKKPSTPSPTLPATTGGGWFWNRRTASTTKIPTVAEEKP